MQITPQRAADRENLAGLVERVTFHNEDSGFCVLRVKARGQRDLITVVGHAAAIGADEFVQASGRWVNDRTHGVQFRADFLRSAPPTTAEGIEKYLASGMIKGIGPIYAKKLVKAFREQVFDVIEQQPERLQEVDGIGPKRADSIVAAWVDQKAIREIMIFLHSHGVGTSRAVRIFKTYGADAIRLISENPYRLARDIRGIGFKSADLIAEKLGIEKTAMIRARAGIGYALTEAMDEGHCGLPLEQLVPTAATLLEVPAEIIETALDLELQDGEVIADSVDGERCIFLVGLHRAERAIAARIRTLSSGALPWPAIDAATAIPWVETKAGISLAPSQREAVQLALTTKALVITGGPGVGKTTLVNSILKILSVKGVRVAPATPHRHRDRAKAPRSGRLRRPPATLGGRAPVRLAGPQPQTGKGLRGQHRFSRSLPLRSLHHAADAPPRTGDMSFESDSKSAFLLGVAPGCLHRGAEARKRSSVISAVLANDIFYSL
jgi:exodeoxyribonuclease V alpha subunit